MRDKMQGIYYISENHTVSSSGYTFLFATGYIREGKPANLWQLSDADAVWAKSSAEIIGKQIYSASNPSAYLND